MKELLKLARQSIESYFSNKEVDLKPYEKFSEKRGVFVTLKIGDKLRGCIGCIKPIMPLFRAVFEMARAAAFSDPRFYPLQEGELKKLSIEISILTIPKQIEADPKNIQIGKDGLIIELGHFSGLLLPQVATEYNWDAKMFLKQTCIKAGLPKDSWKEKNCKIYKFQADIIQE